jgi:hypothetical protein
MFFETPGIAAGGTASPRGGLLVPVWLPLLFLVGLIVPPLLLLLIPAAILDVLPRYALSPAGAAPRVPLAGAFPAGPPRSPPV